MDETTLNADQIQSLNQNLTKLRSMIYQKIKHLKALPQA